MNRRTITLPPDLDGEVAAAVASGVATNLSRFFQDAARHYLDALATARMAEEGARLDPVEETALARGEAPPGPWGRLA